MKISIVIPTYNEGSCIGTLLSYLQQNIDQSVQEIIISDGGSKDDTAAVAKRNGAKLAVSPTKGRAAQMNYGASLATGDVLYFLHADTYPPKDFIRQIAYSCKQGFESGCFRLQFDHKHWFLKANCWFTRFDINSFRFGDQSLFVTKKLFERAGVYNEKLIVLEDQEIIARIKKHGRFKVLKGSVTTSSRKYVVNGVYKTQAVYFLIYAMYRLGFSQPKLIAAYRALIRQDKV
jgi:rSAM/selenodomain-associated transferase 2